MEFIYLLFTVLAIYYAIDFLRMYWSKKPWPFIKPDLLEFHVPDIDQPKVSEQFLSIREQRERFIRRREAEAESKNRRDTYIFQTYESILYDGLQVNRGSY